MDSGQNSLGTSSGAQNTTPQTELPTPPTNNQIITSANLTPATPQNAPLPTDPLHPVQTVGSGTGDLWIGPERRLNKKWLILGLVVSAAIILIVLLAVLLSQKQTSNSNTPIGEINTALIFDTTAPIPVETDGSYGYINPEDGSQVIAPHFSEADRFYGDYAIAYTGTDDSSSRTYIIDRTGETVFSFDTSTSAATFYDVENNIWLINGDAYDTNMHKLSPEGTIGTYIGNGYLLVMSDTEEETTASYIATVDGKKSYDCNSYCSAFTLKRADTVYAIVNFPENDAQIINLFDGKSIYSASGSLSLQDGGLVERSGNSEKYLSIESGRVIDLAQLEAVASDTVSGSQEYVVDPCDNSLYSIRTISGDSLIGCEIEEYQEFSPALYEAYQRNFSQSPILIMRAGGNVELFNLAKVQTIAIFEAQTANVYPNSPFIYVQNWDSGESFVCNVLDKDLKNLDSCLGIGNQNYNVDGHGNYFVVDDGSALRYYNSRLKEI